MDDPVFKPRGEMGGEGVVVWSEADENERAEVRRALENHPEDRIAQPRAALVPSDLARRKASPAGPTCAPT